MSDVERTPAEKILDFAIVAKHLCQLQEGATPEAWIMAGYKLNLGPAQNLKDGPQ